ncbi:MAG: PGF-pre-PGF domain-containing protein [Candidatus Aenigmarchaeota archaeon]|nr:PGF-pre-PGF domain-containing protein [Candidatus Aenigmarchaeota archaeon]
MKGKILIGFLISVLLIPSAQAALQITAFTCNGQTGTVNIENGGTMVCQATVNNPDNSAASISAVTLYPTGSWLEDSTYSASGFSTTVSAGTSTTAAFSGIRPTSSGLNSFSSIFIDSVRDTFVADTTVNVVDFKSLTTSSESSATTGSTVTIFANVLIGGNLDVTLSVSLSSCSLKSGETSSKNLGSLSHNAAGSASWQITMGSSTCSYTVTATGTKGAVSISTSKSGSVTNPAASSDSGSSGSSSSSSSGGSGGATKTTTTTTTTTTTLGKNEATASGGGKEPITFRFDDSTLSVTEIIVKTLGEVTNAKITASVVSEPAISAGNETGVVYKYLKIDKENIKDNDISEVTLVFTVENSWLSGNNLDSDLVVLKRLESDVWKDLLTKKIGVDKPAFIKWDIYVKTGYEAKSPGLSLFAIVAHKTVEKPKTAENIFVSIALVTAFMVIATVLFLRHHHKL